MKLINQLLYQEIPSFVNLYGEQHGQLVFAELAKLVKQSGEWTKPIAELRERASKHTKLPLENALQKEDTPYLNEIVRQMEEKKRVKEKLLQLWEKPLQESDFTTGHSAKDIFFLQRNLMVRYLNINLVIKSDFKKHTIKYKNNDGSITEYRNFKSYWFNDNGEKKLGFSINYGRINPFKNQKEIQDEAQELADILKRLYTRMGYIVFEPKYPRSPDLVVKKGDKEWVIELKLSHMESYCAMVMNYHLWANYRQKYRPFDQESW
ncbi:MAG: hypothetical protein FJY17_00765 [Bacteroidetes bacterium]|nr:hypothetical protein [Bacteroidota bacterium]